jgi:hypothetical protein
MSERIGSKNRARWLAIMAVGLIALAPACGDDDGGDPDAGDGEPGAEDCPAAGQTQTCTCSSRQPMGYRRCTEDLTWTACTCAPVRDAGNNDCMYVGQEILCWPCPGESEGRKTACRQSLTFDCSCGDAGSARDGG